MPNAMVYASTDASGIGSCSASPTSHVRSACEVCRVVPEEKQGLSDRQAMASISVESTTNTKHKTEPSVSDHSPTANATSYLDRIPCPQPAPCPFPAWTSLCHTQSRVIPCGCHAGMAACAYCLRFGMQCLLQACEWHGAGR